MLSQRKSNMLARCSETAQIILNDSDHVTVPTFSKYPRPYVRAELECAFSFHPDDPLQRKPHRRRSKTPDETSAADITKRELKRAKHIMKQLETKMKIMEEEHKKATTQPQTATLGGHLVLEKQVIGNIFWSCSAF